MSEKKTTVTVSRDITAPAAAVWAAIKDFDGVTSILPMFELIAKSNNIIGGTRQLKQGEAVFTERLVGNDDATRTQLYSIVEAPVPFKDYLGAISVKDLGNNRCNVLWTSTFILDGVPESAVIPMVEGIYNTGIDSLAKLPA
ncbi:MAG: SRPBCC family protein [Rhodocyclales bacterium]|jgi:hypothetical protein|nr:SRPBCC family protein [Rhodocyclales bacterium]MBH1975949.1 SRPBCC family protein [Rhodocyclales bacterium]HQN46646.1 SRPBCC family protein [Rugosibacter sp.]HQQ36090.1 SRPBCC family protein [Rugosibacter sp.]